MRKLVLLALLAAAVSGQTASGVEILQSQKGSVPLLVDSTTCMIRFSDSLSTIQIARIAQTLTRLNPTDSLRLPKSHEFVFGIKSGQGVESFVDSVANVPGVEQCEPVYKTASGFRMILHQIITVGFQPTVGRRYIDSVNNLMGTQIDHEILGMPNVFILRKLGNPHMRMLDVSNFYSSLPQVRYAAPDPGHQIFPQGYMLYDYYATQQWQIKKVIGQFNVATVWDFSRVNRNVLVAIIDAGVEEHEDLDSIRVDLGYDFADFDSIAAPGLFMHGMAVAGIIGAKHATNPIQQGLHSTGMVSMNPHARIVPLKVFTDDGYTVMYYQLPDVFTYAYLNGASVINFSWSFRAPDFDYAPLDDAIWRAFHNGRGGKGTPVICAAGDYAGTGRGYWEGHVDYPAYLPMCFSVGSVDGADARFHWSMYGENLGVVAPSADTLFQGDFFSLDRMGNGGWNPNFTYWFGQNVSWNCRVLKDTGNNTNYGCQFGGTSASTAIVSGIASLIISKDSNLTASQIYDIIRNSAVPLGNPQEYGSGRADAFRAILSISHGDVNNDGNISLADLSSLVNYLTGGNFVPFPSTLLGDWNCSGYTDLADLSAMVSYLTGAGSPPVKPCYQF